MIKITIHYWPKQTIKSLCVQGHALKKGEEINPACACVSNIMLGLLNWLKETGEEQALEKKVIKDGYIMLHFPQTQKWTALLNLIVIQLKMTHDYFRSTISWKVFK